MLTDTAISFSKIVFIYLYCAALRKVA